LTREQNCQILIVEKHPSIIQLYLEILSHVSTTISTTNNGNSAHQFIQYFPDFFDLVIADAYISDISGVNFLQKIRKKRTNLPVVFVTTDTSKIAMLNRFDEYTWAIDKPFKIEAFKNFIESIMNLD